MISSHYWSDFQGFREGKEMEALKGYVWFGVNRAEMNTAAVPTSYELSLIIPR